MADVDDADAGGFELIHRREQRFFLAHRQGRCWLGHDEEQVKDLGLSTLSLPVEDVERRQLENKTNKVGLEAAKTVPQQRLPGMLDEAGDAKEQQLRCLKCYSADITCRELDKLMTRSGEWLSDPLPVHAKICTCRSCGYEWDDEDNT